MKAKERRTEKGSSEGEPGGEDGTEKEDKEVRGQGAALSEELENDKDDNGKDAVLSEESKSGTMETFQAPLSSPK